MIVSFPFTFSFSVPGLPNPFSLNYSQPGSQPSAHIAEPAPQSAIKHKEINMAIKDSQLANSPSPPFAAIPRPNGLKRGWEPAFAESSHSTTLVSTSGYLDPPSKHREMVNAISMHDHTEEELPPPSKKRRGLAGSIVSTAVNAALIGTAVGLTVYRLWRSRGKEPQAIETTRASPESESGFSQQLLPPPPYQEREWTPVSYPSPPAESLLSLLPSPTPRRKVVRHNTRRPKRTRVPHPQTLASPGRTNTAGSSSHTQFENDFGRDGGEGTDDQMDWIQDRLSQLIEQGKKALNREVVVMSDAKEDEVDDGSGVWEEDEDYQPSTSFRRTGSLRRGAKRSRGHFYGTSNSSSHSLPSVSPHTPRRKHVKGFSVDSFTRDVMKEDESAWGSPELRETMQRARERMLAGRGTS